MGGSGGWGVGWVGMGSGGVGKFPRIFPEVSENFPGIFREFSGITGNFNVTLCNGKIKFRHTACTKIILRS